MCILQSISCFANSWNGWTNLSRPDVNFGKASVSDLFVLSRIVFENINPIAGTEVIANRGIFRTADRAMCKKNRQVVKYGSDGRLFVIASPPRKNGIKSRRK